MPEPVLPTAIGPVDVSCAVLISYLHGIRAAATSPVRVSAEPVTVSPGVAAVLKTLEDIFAPRQRDLTGSSKNSASISQQE